MFLHIPNVLTSEQAQQARKLLEKAEWVDGRLTAGAQAALAKNNMELKKGQPAEAELAALVRKALDENKLFSIAALPDKISPPMFNRYQGGQAYGMHVDNVFRQVPDDSGKPVRLRGDLSATLFLSEPSEYDGGELVIGEALGVQNIKLPAGHLALYPTTSLHEVKAVTRGARLASFFWVESLVRDGGKRAILLDLDLAIQKLYRENPKHPSLDEFLGVYHNLLRRWSED